LSAATGATLKELMARLGHSSVRDKVIAKALGTFFPEAKNATDQPEEASERGEQDA
jgi:hypothetical protein